MEEEESENQQNETTVSDCLTINPEFEIKEEEEELVNHQYPTSVPDFLAINSELEIKEEELCLDESLVNYILNESSQINMKPKPQEILHSVEIIKIAKTSKIQPSKLEIEKLKCQFCNKNFIKQSTLRNHIISIHTRVKSYFCDLCNYGTINITQLTAHMKRKHMNPASLNLYKYKSKITEIKI